MKDVWLHASPLFVGLFLIACVIVPVVIKRRNDRLRIVRPYLGETIPHEPRDDL